MVDAQVVTRRLGFNARQYQRLSAGRTRRPKIVDQLVLGRFGRLYHRCHITPLFLKSRQSKKDSLSGRMVGGFALIAWPAVFESSGIMTFIVGPDGEVCQKDLGPETARIAAKMTTFDPDLTWSRVAMTND